MRVKVTGMILNLYEEVKEGKKNLCVDLYQKGEKQVAVVKRIPLDVFAALGEGEEITLPCKTFLYNTGQGLGLALSYLE